MTHPSIKDLRARVAAVKTAPVFAMKAPAELALVDLLNYLEVLEKRVSQLEGVNDGKR